MEALAAQAAVVILILSVCFSGPAIAIVFLARRKRNARALRRSPIGQQMLRGPGHSLRAEIEDAGYDVLADLTLLIVIPLVALTIFLAQSQVRGLGDMWHLAPIYFAGGVAAIWYGVRKLLRTSERLDKLRAGYDAEVAVGQELDQLMRHGAVVFHDFPAEKFNIDHVVIAPQGVFAVETKGFTKSKAVKGKAAATVTFDGDTLKFPNWTTVKPLEQTQRQANWLADWLSSAIGNRVSVLPVLALPGWYVERKARGNVRVYNGKELAGLLRANGTMGVSAENLQRIVHQIEQRCRNVAPRYREED